MKTLRFLATVLAVSTFCGAAMADSPKNLLFYGNSFTIGIGSTEAESYGGVPEVVRQLAIAAGYPEPRVENAAVSGQSLGWHLANNAGAITNPADFMKAPDFQWDAVIIQEFSTEPTHIGNPANFRANALTMFNQVRSHSPAAKGVLFETWARGPGHSYYTGGSPLFPGGPAQMQQEVRDNYELARQDLAAAHGNDSVSIATVGDAWEATGWDNLHSTDIYHANTRGTYLTGLVIFGTIYGESTTVGLPKLFGSLTAQEAADLQAIADEYLPAGLTFDANGDRSINGDDLAGFAACLAGPEAPYAPGADCLLMDGTGDASVDLRDFALMQTSAFDLLPCLTFATWDLTFTLPAGSGTDSLMETVSATDGSMPTVSLTAIDLTTMGTPTWLTTPASITADTPFLVEVDVTGLAAGSYHARVAAAAAGYTASSFTVALHVTPTGGPQEILVDFGDVAQTTAGNYNNITHTQGPVPNAIDSTGLATGISITVTDSFWPGSNQNGTTSPTGDAAANFDAQATRDNLFGNTVIFGGFTEPTGGLTLAGLSTDPGVTYTFTFFAGRLGVGDNRETQYDVAGSNSGVAFLNTANNQSEVVAVSNIAADTNGEIVISVGPGPNNTNASGFYYIGAMKIARNMP